MDSVKQQVTVETRLARVRDQIRMGNGAMIPAGETVNCLGSMKIRGLPGVLILHRGQLSFVGADKLEPILEEPQPDAR